ncbi:MAG: DNA-processing protein DprA [Clostridia bacterium]|nr:DNA-processing protein DprA [Clostridia bacterium]
MKHQLLYIWLQQAVGLYSRLVSDIFNKFQSIEDIYNCEDFSFLGESKAKYIKRLENKDNSSAFEVMKRCESLGVKITGYYDELYPEKLRGIEMPPVALYSIGDFRDLNKTPCIAIVGTRNMTDYGKQTAESFAYNFAKSGAYVISGLAKGIDTAAHRGAVMADGYTVAVLGNPIGDIYPKENLKAFETLYKRGLVISELYPGAPRTRADFPNRNRIISGISNAVVIAEAGETSGALITARHATSQGRAVFAVPGAIGAENAGTNKLIKNGIPAATEPMDVLSALMLEYPERIKTYEPSLTEQLKSYGNKAEKREKISKPKARPVAVEETVRTAPEFEELKTDSASEPMPSEKQFSGELSERIMTVLKGPRAVTADEISARTGIGIADVMTELTFMEIDGTIIACPGGRFVSSKF